jgi:KDO2-lipid IV(A) lauroyltransferase
MVLVGAHHGNFEWMLLRMSLEFGDRLIGLYKPLRQPRIDGRMKAMRSRFGARLVPAKSILRELANFREAAAIGMVADQVPRTSPEKHWVTFLGQDTAFFMGPELLGRALRSQVLLAKMRRLDRGRYELEFESLNEPGEKLPSGEITARYARGLEAWIREDPPGWWWSHRRWKLKR